MRKFNLLSDYPKSSTIRYVSDSLRTIDHRIIASYKDRDFYDGDRNFGYGGFKYDGRWKIIAKKICEEYKLKKNSKILQLGCEKGFLLHDLKNLLPESEIFGLETSNYPINNSMENVKKSIIKTKSYEQLDFEDKKFDFVIGLGIVYTHTLKGAINCLKEIQRVTNGNSFITLASYRTKEDYWMFKQWTLLGTTILLEDEWLKVLRHTNYQGDYYFTNASELNLQSK